MKLRDFKLAIAMPQDSQTQRYHYVIYCRKSSESEDRQMQSIPDQIKALTESAATRSLSVKSVFRESMSAKAPGRPKFNEMISIIQEKKDTQGIICWSLSRLSRNPVDSATIMWLLQQGTIKEVITASRVYTEQDADLLMAVETAKDNRFIRDLRKDTKRGIESKLDKGHFPGIAPPGYINNTHKRQGEKDISPHPTYFTLMRKVFDLALTGNFNAEQLHQKARSWGVRTIRNTLVTRSQMYQTFHNPFYTGKFLYDGKLYQGAHQRMLTDEEFDLLQDILFNRHAKPLHRHTGAFLNGLMVCGECNMAITAEEHRKTYTSGKTQVFGYYRCTKKGRGGDRCSQAYTPAKELERQVIGFLSQIRLSQPFVDWAIKQLNEANLRQQEAREARYQSLKVQYDACVRKVDNLLELKISPDNFNGQLISDNEFANKKQELELEKAKVTEQLSSVDKHINEWTELAARTFDFAAKAQERFANGTIEDKKIILRAVGSNLALKDKKLTITPRTPFLLIQQALSKSKTLSQRLEPTKRTDTFASYPSYLSPDPVWGDVGDSNPL